MTETLLNLLKEYWIVPVLAVLFGGPQVLTFIKSIIGNIKLPFFSNKVDGIVNSGPSPDKDLVMKDIETIYWLADRAVDANDEELILELENVNKKFYHIHRAMRKSATSTK